MDARYNAVLSRTRRSILYHINTESEDGEAAGFDRVWFSLFVRLNEESLIGVCPLEDANDSCVLFSAIAVPVIVDKRQCLMSSVGNGVRQNG